MQRDQHFSEQAARTTLGECGRVLEHSSTATVQMPKQYGARNIFHQMTQRK